MDEALEHHAVGAGFGHLAYLVDGKLPREHDAVCTQSLGLLKGFGMGEVGQRGERDGASVAGLARHVDHGQILDDEAIAAHLGLQTVDEAEGRVELLLLDKRVHGHRDPAACLVGEVRQLRELGQAEVFRLHAG